MERKIYPINPNVKVASALNRRNDHEIRSAIDDLQELLFDPQATTRIFERLIKHLTAISQSTNGSVFILNKPVDLSLEFQGAILEFTEINSGDQPNFIRQEILSQLLSTKAFSLRPVFYNTPLPKVHKQLLRDPEGVSGLILIPMLFNNIIKGVCVLITDQQSYDPDLLRRFKPLLGSALCSLRSVEAVGENFPSLTQKIADNRYLSSLISASPLAILVLGPDLKILTSNQSADMMFGGTDSLYLEGYLIAELIPSYQSIFQWSTQKNKLLNNDSHLPIQTLEDQIAHKVTGEEFVINFTVFRHTHGRERFTTLQIQDVTRMRSSAEEYKETLQQFLALTHLVPVSIIRIDTQWNCIYANDQWYALSGLSYEESKDQQWINAFHSEEVSHLLESLHDSIQLGKDYQAEVRLLTPLGQVRWAEFNTRTLFNERGEVVGFLGTFADITERLVQQEKLRHVAEYDNLTGLVNRNLFQNRLQHAFRDSTRSHHTITVFFIDLDGFKDINDTLGHNAGDELLRQVANRLLNVLRKDDTIARFGGDEFVVLLNAHEELLAAAQIAEKVIQSLSQLYIVDDNKVYVTASMGIASGTAENSSPEKILKQADAALYLAKSEGKNNFQLFNADLDKQSRHRLSMVNQLRQAIVENNFLLYYQPQANVQTEQIVGYEALLRLRNNDGEIIEPLNFIAILEESGMMIEVGYWIIESAIKQLTQWLQGYSYPDNASLSINVSPKQLLDESLPGFIQEKCREYQLNPCRLVVEITETVIINRPEKVKEALNRLKQVGVYLALDDFGTGYSSLSYLQQYPFDHIKIDKSFIDGLLMDENNAKITKAIVMLAHSLGIKFIAEGVGDQQSLALLKEYGADYYQGYFLGRPLAPEILNMGQPDNHQPPPLLT